MRIQNGILLQAALLFIIFTVSVKAQRSGGLIYYPNAYPVSYVCQDGMKYNASIELCENSGAGKLRITRNGKRSNTIFVKNIESVIMVNSDSSNLCIIRGAPIQARRRRGRCYALYKPWSSNIKPWMMKKCRGNTIVSMKQIRCGNVYG